MNKTHSKNYNDLAAIASQENRPAVNTTSLPNESMVRVTRITFFVHTHSHPYCGGYYHNTISSPPIGTLGALYGPPTLDIYIFFLPTEENSKERCGVTQS